MGLSWVYRHPSLTGHARGLLTSLVILLLLWLSSAQLRVVGPDQPVTATVGQDVVLPCHLSPQRDARSLEVRWIQDKFSETVHHYRNGEDLYGEQMGAYAGRTELVRDGLSSGRLDLRITGLRPSDDGLYVCIVKDGDAYVEATVHLVVSDPFFQKCQTLIVVLVLVPVLFVVSIGLGVYCFRKQATQRRELADQAAVEGECPCAWAPGQGQGAISGRVGSWERALQGFSLSFPDEYRAKAERQSARLKELAAELVSKDTEREEQAAELGECPRQHKCDVQGKTGNWDRAAQGWLLTLMEK
ncbi:myelin-oligodendrocyte glycoprotein-like isoform X8 [Anas acuta]|uniref:myelin-oligodendrocyte glycoprotein-like isoform X8 n=1 Tax=Anas acuta TaxID=28680 RepID=UPI0035C8FEC0